MPTFPKTPDALRRYLERGGQPISDAHWRLAIERGHVGYALGSWLEEEDREEAEVLLRDYLSDLREGAAERPQRPAREPSAVSRHGSPGFEAAAHLAALAAAERPEVVAFRRQHLPDGLVSLKDVPALVERWQRADGADGRIAEAKLLIPGKRLPSADEYLSGRPVTLRGRYQGGGWLHLAVPDPRPNRLLQIPVTLGGIICQLRDAALGLVSDLHWSEQAAVGFILTGRAPRTGPGGASASWSAEPSGHRITLRVHPAMTGREVAGLYEQIRARVTWWPRKGIGEPAGALAVFVAEANDGRSWADAARAWAADRPTDAFGDWRDFRRQATRAYSAVTGGRKLVWLGKPGPARRRRRTPPSRLAH